MGERKLDSICFILNLSCIREFVLKINILFLLEIARCPGKKWICMKEKSITQHVLVDRSAAGVLFSLEIRTGIGTVTSY